MALLKKKTRALSFKLWVLNHECVAQHTAAHPALKRTEQNRIGVSHIVKAKNCVLNLLDQFCEPYSYYTGRYVDSRS
jgi:hypothetical protein